MKILKIKLIVSKLQRFYCTNICVIQKIDDQNYDQDYILKFALYKKNVI